MKHLLICLMTFFFCIGNAYAEDKEKEKIPVNYNWSQTNDRSDESPQLYQDSSSVYVYSEKQLDNLTIGIIDMMGNVYHQEVTIVPAGMYYAISTESLPEGQYYLCIYQGSNYAIGLFTVNR